LGTRTISYVVLLLLLIYLFLRFVLPYVMPFAIGAFLAFLLEPVVSFFVYRVRLRRSWSAFVTILVVLAVFSYLISLGVARLFSEVADLYQYFPQYYAEIQELVERALSYAGEVSGRFPRPIQAILQDQWNRIYEVLAKVVTGAGGIIRTLPEMTVSAIFTLLSTYFMIRDRAHISEFLRDLVPAGLFQAVRNVELDILRGVAGFVRVQTVLIGITMLVNVVGLALLGARYSVVLGILVALLDLLPVVGPGVVYVPWTVYEFTWGNPARGVGLIALYGGVSVFRQIAQTHLVGRELGLHPLETLLSLYVGYKLFRVPGLVYGPLVAIFLKGLWKSGVIPRER